MYELWYANDKSAKAVKPVITVKALKKHKAKVTWKKVALKYSAEGLSGSMLVSGYQIYRSTKKGSGYKKIKQISGAGKVTFTDSKLKKGKKYYYKVRTYTKINGKTYLGKWSKIVKVKAK